MEESLRIQKLEELPSPSEFASQIETRNVPAVFNGCVKEWKAFSRWNPSNGGLDYLQELVGSSIVEAMLSRSAPVFYGDLRSHERVPIPFSTFIGFCKQNMQNAEDSPGVCLGSEHQPMESGTEQELLLSRDAPDQIYLAQVPIMNAEIRERVQLENLREDIKMPSFLETKSLASINLWMNNAQARSSTHNDPHHNILCIVSGCKQVVLWPPSASPLLYPMPIYGEASNHSSVALENPDFSRYPRAEGSMEYAQKVVLNAGDALFIPEGWFHQVDSDKLTIAVNFWWQSYTMSSMSEHMDAYYLRRILRRLTDREMNEVLHKTFSASRERLNSHTGELTTNDQAGHSCDSDHACDGMDLKRKEKLRTVTLHELEPCALQAVHELVSLVHDRVNVADQKQSSCTGTKNSVACAGDESIKITVGNSYNLEDDPIAKVLWNLEPPTFQNVILTVANNFPRTLEAFILHLLSPVGAEVLTRKFDEMDLQTTEEDRNKFYQIFYGSFDDQFAAMDAILNGKESFGRQVFMNVLDKYLGVHCDVQKSKAG
ncbi:hypothetical protein HS088_TW22G00731 [Tripterygium wilfordii]|uniref:JmjC domain-containing protein n=1 Tax=Tripterygium wilfordii TaxID=458696 RepID=A0A7J7BYU5_TRIWF|nr:uncharacterized protein LOC119990742 [Tripterygium wilfordii]KAF5727044.1 hypothetical protein HS088_TW22G00731 [Tripterygium wilfordii]